MINTTGLKEPQVPHVKRLVDSLYLTGHAEDLSETGTGKTYCGAAVARELNVPFLVICPKIVIPQWEAILKIFGIKAIGIINYEKLTRGNKNSKYTFWRPEETKVLAEGGGYVMEERLRYNTNVPPNALIIFDEVHECSGLESLKSILLMTAREQGFKRLAVSASACTRVTEMKAFGFSSMLHNHTCHNDFKKNFAIPFGAEQTGSYGNVTLDLDSKKAKEGMLKVNHFLYDVERSASRLTKADMREFFMDNHIMATALSAGTNTAKINKVYDQMQYELDKLDERTADYSRHVFALMIAARRKAELLKCPTYISRVMGHLRDGNSVVLFLNFSESIKCVRERLEKEFSKKTFKETYGDIKVAVVKGGQNSTKVGSENNRQTHIDRFQADEARVMICNTAAGGVGVSFHDLHGNYPRVSIISPSFFAIKILQALGRIHRADAKSDALQEIVFAAGTIEEQACAAVQGRMDNLALLNEGDLTNGIQFYNDNVSLQEFEYYDADNFKA